MQGVSSAAMAWVQGSSTYPLRDGAAQTDLTTLVKADVATQRSEQAANFKQMREAGQGHANQPHRGETDRLLAKVARLTRALSRLLAEKTGAGQNTVQAGAAVLVSGEHQTTGGVSLTISAGRISGLYTDFKSGLAPLAYYNDAKLADTLVLNADVVENVDTAGGSDAVTITAREVSGIFTGNDADAVSIIADVVRDVSTDAGDVDWIMASGAIREAGDAVAIAARIVDGVSTGGDNDAIAVMAGVAVGLDAGAGNDAISVQSLVVGGISGGAGDDVITVDAAIGQRLSRDPQEGGELDPVADKTAAARMASALAWGSHVGGGDGNDAITVRAQSTIGIAGGAGDDTIALQGGTVGLYYRLGDGNDSVALAAGTEAVVQIGAEFTGFALEWGEDSLTLRLGEGSITFTGTKAAGAIGLRHGAGEVILLQPGAATLDRVA
ncbi:hypothetical protein [Rhodobacter ferrooxidans]|uniref:Hemolysin-type calcium-binding region n=1 Tax=Rhodobacter ferrooxidans TaxID=371731 RepID=C8S0A4_9RHOB|nr:hypothetical protein [Rhodobacter sp. SW2]EEW25713.1 hypothetical protein Rsw2DRAFT_1482 [Rhodobacter sp. SW2]